MTWICDQEAEDHNEKYWVNIRGNIGYLRKTLIDLVPESGLAQLFNNKNGAEEMPFLDKDPESFKNVVRYLANGCQVPKLDKNEMKLLAKELDYWRIPYNILTIDA